MKKVILTLPDIRAISRNQTTGHWHKYSNQLMIAEQWAVTFGRRVEYHFTKRVDVYIVAYYDARGHKKAADTPNIDDKIFTDILIKKKLKKRGAARERAVWFIEDDNPKYLRRVTKESVPSDRDMVVITITEVEE